MRNFAQSREDFSAISSHALWINKTFFFSFFFCEQRRKRRDEWKNKIDKRRSWEGRSTERRPCFCVTGLEKGFGLNAASSGSFSAIWQHKWISSCNPHPKPLSITVTTPLFFIFKKNQGFFFIFIYTKLWTQ